MTKLIDLLPSVEGSYRENASLASLSWFRVGGAAEVLFKPKNEEDLSRFLKKVPDHVPITLIGVGSNLLIRDGGIKGVTIRLGAAFGKVTIKGQILEAGAAALDVTIAKQAAKAGISGLSFYAGVPGTIGGALRMNAGAHGAETKDHLVSARVMDTKGEIHTLGPDQLGHAYRTSAVPKNWIFLSATYKGDKLSTEVLEKQIKEVQDYRAQKQPINSRTGGSTFKNPPNNSSWKLIDAAGMRGHRVGGAQVSELHCNFLLNTGDATAWDLETLGELMRERVFKTSGVLLEWEIKRLGDFIPGEEVTIFQAGDAE